MSILRSEIKASEYQFIEFDISQENSDQEAKLNFKSFTLLKAIFYDYSLSHKTYKWDRNLELYLQKVIDNKSFRELGKEFNMSANSANLIYKQARKIIRTNCIKSDIWNEYPILKDGLSVLPDVDQRRYGEIIEELQELGK